jgi:hypothetical protein
MNDVTEMPYYFEFKMHPTFKRGICSKKYFCKQILSKKITALLTKPLALQGK